MVTPSTGSVDHPPIDFEQLRLQRRPRLPSQPADFDLPGVVKGEGYFVVRIPMRWFNALGKVSGKAVVLGLLLWRWAVLKKGCSTVRVRPGEARAAGISRNTMYAALDRLEQAGLIVVVSRQRCRAAVVRIVDVPCGDAGSAVSDNPADAEE